MTKTSFLSVLTCFILTLTGCRHKDFCYDHPHGNIYVAVEYDDDNDADDMVHLRDNVRATRLMVYDPSTGESVLASDMERKTYRLGLDPGNYHFIAHNAGTRSISFAERDMFYSHSVTTRECDILEPLYGSNAVQSDIDLGIGEPVVIQAEPIWSIGAETVACGPGDTIRLTASPLHCRYTYEMRDIEGLAGVSRISSFITGMSRGASLGASDLHDVPVTVAVPASIGSDRKSVVGSFICFGYNPRIDTRHRMGLFVEMESGAKYKLLEGEHFDVTGQVTEAVNRRRVHIVIDGVRLPSHGGGSGFDINVSPWSGGENLDIDYHIQHDK